MPAQQNDGRNAPLIHYIYYTRAHFLHTRRTDKCSLPKCPTRQPAQEHSPHPHHSTADIKTGNAVRCMSHRSALHQPSQRAATGNAPRYVGKGRMHTLSLQGATPIPTADSESPKSIPHQSLFHLFSSRDKHSGRQRSKLEEAKKHTINTILSSKENHRSPPQAI